MPEQLTDWNRGDSITASHLQEPVAAGLAGAVACCMPLALGVAIGEEEIGVIACFGGLNAALGVPRGVLRERAGWGAGAALACCLSVAVATGR